ncbi:hypothetical protein [Luteolibacter sp. Populi]|uniref:hypothetical protein n=1 Tax=Luteolibacter sp. Populi TaxID=3230487 RepID=UPI00346507A4
MRSRFPLAALALALPMAAAEEQPADFGEGLKQLAALGLPEMKDARWVKAPGGDEEERALTQSYEFREMNLKLRGGVWKLAGEPARMIEFGSAAEVAPAGGEEKEDAGEEKEEEPSLLQKMLRSHASKNPPKEASAKATDPLEEADSKSISEALGKAEIGKKLAERQEYSPSEVPGRLLIFAAQLQAAGKTEAANRVAAAVFALPLDKEQVIDSAVSQFADVGYEAATKAFFEDRDWTKYRDAVKALLVKYPRGWKRAGGVAMLVPGLEKRAAGTRPPPPALPGIELKPEAVAALDQLLDPPADPDAPDDDALARSRGIDLSRFPAAQRGAILRSLREQGLGDEDDSGSGLWLLGTSEAKPDANPATRLKAMKMDGLIALAAVAGDETLVAMPSSNTRDSYSYGRDRSLEELAREAYDNMTRPRSRGEIVTSLLQEVLPAGEDDSETDSESVAASAVEFWKTHRGDSEVQLAVLYLNEGDEGQRSMAGNFLANHADAEAHAAFEKAVLGSGDPGGFAVEVTAYLEKRKAAALPFFEAYSKVLKTALDGVDVKNMDYARGNYAIQQAGSVEKFLKTLAVKVGATSLKELVEAAMKSGDVAEMQGLAAALASTPVPKCLHLVAEPAAKATPEVLMQLLQVIVQRTFQNRREHKVNEEPAEKLPGEVIALWRPLIERAEQLPEIDPKNAYFPSWTRGYGGKTCGDAVAMALELSTYPGSGPALNQYADINGGAFNTVLPFVRSRVEAWTAGKTAPAWPDAAKVGVERKKEIAAKLAELPSGELAAFAQGLPPDERMALAEIVRGYTAENPAPPGVLELRLKVTGRRAYNFQMDHDNAILDQFGISEGYIVSADKIAELGERLAREAKERSGTQLAFFSGPMGLGAIACAQRAADPRKATVRGNPSQLPRYFEQYGNPEALVMLSSSLGYEFWSLKEGTVKKEESSGNRAGLERLKTGFEEKFGVLPYLSIQVLTREDADKTNNPEEEE